MALPERGFGHSTEPSTWRHEPYRVLFPLGWLLAFAGTGPWLLFAAGLDTSYRSIFHAMAQVQGFLTCYALGFLLTFVPRRTGTAPPPAWLMVMAVVCPVATTALAFAGQWLPSQVPWVLLLMLTAGFAVTRARNRLAPRALPPSFVWIPMSLAAAVIGTVVTGAAAAAGAMGLHDAARGVVLQGTFTGLMVGVGSFLLPMLVYRETPPEPPPPRQRSLTLVHTVAALAFFASFVLEWTAFSAAYALRAALIVAVFTWTAKLHHAPTQPGTHRKLAWLGAWCIPMGFGLVAALPGYRHVGLHLVFIGGFGMSTFAVSLHVALSHGGAASILRAPSRLVQIMGALLAAAISARLLAVLDVSHFKPWLGVAAMAFLAAALVWARIVAAYVGPRS